MAANSEEVAVDVDISQEKAEETLHAENSNEKVASNDDSNSETSVGLICVWEEEFNYRSSGRLQWSAIMGRLKGEDELSREVSVTGEVNDAPHPVSFLEKWKKIFVTSCLFAVLLDPLFLYVPTMNDEIKCLLLDRNLKIAALVLRSVTDFFYIMDIFVQIYRSDEYSGLVEEFRRSPGFKLKFLRKSVLPKLATTIWASYNILIDLLAILPLPQVMILILFSKIRDLKTLTTTRMVIINLFVLSQYVPRSLRIYLSCKELKNTPKGETGETAMWVKGVLNFFIYILASHVLGAVWYFFSIQRMTVCWHSACGKKIGCDLTTFGCHDHHTSRNVTFLNDLCPISPADASVFDFGIYITVLESGIPGSTNYFQKFSNCFWWGLRNLSSLGSNLQPSIDGWENLFAAFISIIGLLLFLYLIGNLQTYMQLETTRIEVNRHKAKMDRKMREKDREVDLWLTKNGIPKKSNKDIKLEIMEKVRQELEENRSANLDNIVSILPPGVQSYIKSCMPFTKLKQVPVLQKMDELVLKVLCEHLEPRVYADKDIIFGMNEPLRMMVFIVDGLVQIGNDDLKRGAGELCGEELLAWPSSTSFPYPLPMATESATAIGDVEALVLSVSAMESVGSKFRRQFFFQTDKSNKEQLSRPLGFAGTATPRVFTEEELEKATKYYSASRVLGEGAYAIVYRGVLQDKTVVAVKKAKDSYSFSELANELTVASETNHKSLVKLLGCCIETSVPILVSEYISNGTLYQHIHKKDGKGSPPLSLELRLKIAAEIAKALAYLHSLSPISIVHRDVKTINILLDDNYRAKLFDFGCSALVDEGKRPMPTTVQGTLGYLDPQHIRSQMVTDKIDVYSFGVVLAELLTSKVALSHGPEGKTTYLANLFLSAMEEDHLLNDIFDSEVINKVNIRTAKKVADLAKRCLRPEGKERPSMYEVAEKLKGLRN